MSREITPVDAAGVEPARRVRLAGFQSRFRRQVGLRIQSGEGEARTHKAVKLAGFRIRCRRPTLGLPLQSGRRTTRKPHPRVPCPVSSRGQDPAWFIVHERRAEQSKPTPRGRALVSSEARSLSGSLSLRTLPRIRTEILCGLSAAPLTVGLEGHGADDRVRTGDLDVGNVAL